MPDPCKPLLVIYGLIFIVVFLSDPVQHLLRPAGQLLYTLFTGTTN